MSGGMRASARAHLAATLLLAAAFFLAPPAGAAAAAPPVELAETRPIETTLGNPALPAAAEVWLDMIAGAEKTLDLEHFYLSHWPGEPLAPILDALGAAARRGVRVRLLLDRGMASTYPSPADSLGRVPGIELRLVDFRALAGGAQHAKLMVADRTVVDRAAVFVGSPNLDWRALKHIHELGVRVRDPHLAAAFGGVFDLDWAAADTLAAPEARAAAIDLAKASARAAAASAPYSVLQAPGDTARIVPGWSPLAAIPDTTHWDRTVIASLIDGARRDLAIQLLNYGIEGRGGRDSTIDDALRGAAARGVRVRLLVSDWQAGSRGMAATQSLARVPNIEVRMMTIPEWSGGYIPYARVQHTKFMAVDGEAVWIGTANWDPSYWSASRNLSVTLWNKPLVAAVMTSFERSWGDPGAAPIDPARTYEAKIRGATPPPGKTAYGR